MEREEYEVTIRRIETCRVRVATTSKAEAIEMALMEERCGNVANHVYSDEHVEVARIA